MIGAVFNMINLSSGNHGAFIYGNIIIRYKNLDEIFDCDKSFHNSSIGHINAGLIRLSEQIFNITDMDIVFP